MKTDQILKDLLTATLQSATKDQIVQFVNVIWQSEEAQFVVLKEYLQMSIGEPKKRVAKKPLEHKIGELLVPKPRGRPKRLPDTKLEDARDIRLESKRHKPKDDLPDLGRLTDEELAELAKDVGVEVGNDDPRTD